MWSCEAGESFVWAVWQSRNNEEDKITTRAICCPMQIPYIQGTYHSIIRNAAAWYDKKKVLRIGCFFSPILVTKTKNLNLRGIRKNILPIEDYWIHQLPYTYQNNKVPCCCLAVEYLNDIGIWASSLTSLRLWKVLREDREDVRPDIEMRLVAYFS